MAIIDTRVQIGTTPIWGTPFTEGHLRRMMERYGIDKCIVSSTMANSCDFINGNKQIKEIAGKDGILGCAVVNTQYPPEAIEDLRLYMGLNSFASVMIRSGSPDKPVTIDEADDILNSLRRFNKPVMIEASSREAVLAATEIAKGFPTLRFLLLSMGGSAWRTAVDVAERTLNLYLEVSGNPNPDKIKMGLDKVGPHRMMFGSNMPFTDPSVTVGLVEGADISDGIKRAIFEENANRFFGWSV